MINHVSQVRVPQNNHRHALARHFSIQFGKVGQKGKNLIQLDALPLGIADYILHLWS